MIDFINTLIPVGKIIVQNLTCVDYTIIYQDLCNNSTIYKSVNSTEYLKTMIK